MSTTNVPGQSFQNLEELELYCDQRDIGLANAENRVASASANRLR